MMHLTTAFALAVSVLAPVRLTVAQATSSEAASVDSLFADYTRGLRPGLAVAVVRDGKVLLTKGYGYANLEHRVPITPATVFDVASVSKQFTGLAIAMLVTDDRVKLTDDIRKYIPELADVGRTVTIDNLLHHVSGYRDWPGTLSLAGWRMDDVISFDQILTFASNQRTLNFVPGAEYTYSNTGYNLLAETVARVSRKSFRQFTDERLFRPLGMTSSHFHDDHQQVVANRAYGYASRPDGGYSAVTNNLTALGSSSLPTVSHSGGWAAFSTFVLHFPQQHFGVIVLANTGINTGCAAFNVADIFLGRTLGPAATPANPLASGPTPNVATAVLDKYAGLYRLGPGWYVRIRRDGGTLKTQATREGEVLMAARSDTSFWVEGYRAPMTFQAAAGQPVYLTYRGERHPKLDDGPAPSPAQLRELTGEYESEELKASYLVELTDSGLVMKHRRHGTIKLTRLWNDDFGGSAWFTRSVEFQRDQAGRATGFSVFIDERSRDVRFTKRR